MTKRHRRRLAVAVFAVVAGLAAWYGYTRMMLLRDRIPGTYTGVAPDGQSTTVTRFAPDGTWSAERYPPGATQPQSTTRGRWRVSGRILVLETGPAATAPVGLLRAITERYEGPLLSPEVTRVRLISADDAGLVWSYGNDVYTGQSATEILTRQAGES